MIEPVFSNPTDDQIHALLTRCKRIAVLGLSANRDRPAWRVSRAMQGYGYAIQPVNPACGDVLGVPSMANLSELEEAVDLANVFRHPSHVPAIVDKCIDLRLPALWLQEGVIDHAAAARAVQAGIFTVMDRCIYKEYLRMGVATRNLQGQ